MNLRAMANTLTSRVNPNRSITWRRGGTWTQDPDTLARVPSYTDVTLTGQIQPLTSDDMALIQGLNVQGYHRAIYLNAQSAGVVRGKLKPLDLFIWGGQTWRVLTTPEAWDESGWSRVFVTLQQTIGDGADRTGNG